MTQNEVIPGFDCVASKRKAQEQIYAEIRDLSPEEELLYFERHARSGPLGDLWRTLTERSKADRADKQAPKTRRRSRGA